MIERVARAIYDASEPSCEWAEAIHDIYYIVARAAIIAMREPTDEMLDEVSQLHSPTATWKRMIDAALKE